MAAGFGTGIGLQGQPPIYGQYFNQRQQQEEARRNAKIKRDDDAYQKILEETVIKPGEYDWKVETKAREAVADFTYQVNKLRQEHPNTWENMVPQLKQDTLGKLQGYRSDSVALKAIRDAKKTGKYYVPDSAGQYLDTNQGDMKGGLPGIVDQKLYGFVVDPETGHLGYNPVEKRSIQQEIEQRITSKKDAFQDEIDPKTGLPKVYVYKGQGGAMEQQTRRTLQPQQVDDLYAGLTTDPHFSQNINIAYANELKKRPDYNDAMIVGPDGNFNPNFLTGATEYGRKLAGDMARNYYTPNTIPMPGKGTNITVNTGDGGKKGEGVSSITSATYRVGAPTGQKVKDPVTDEETDGFGEIEVTSEAQFTTPNFKVQRANTTSVFDVLTGQKITGPEVANAEYAPFAVVPVFKGGKNKGKTIGNTYGIYEGGGKKTSRTLQNAIDDDEVEWKVVAIGSYEDRNGNERSIYQDADEVRTSAEAKLSEADSKAFKSNINEQYSFAKAKNNGYRSNFEQWQADGRPAGKTSNPGAVKTSGSTLQDRKGNPNKPKVSDKADVL